MKKYKDIGVYDFSDYAEEITGDALFEINGGAEVENSHEGVAGANVGDTITRKDGTVVTLKQADIDYAQKQLGDTGNASGGNAAGGSSGSGQGNTSGPGSSSTSSQTVKNENKWTFNPNEPDTDKRYNAKDVVFQNQKLHVMAISYDDAEYFEIFATYYANIGQYGAAGTPVYDGIGLIDNDGNIFHVFRDEKHVFNYARKLENIELLEQRREQNIQKLFNSFSNISTISGLGNKMLDEIIETIGESTMRDSFIKTSGKLGRISFITGVSSTGYDIYEFCKEPKLAKAVNVGNDIISFIDPVLSIKVDIAKSITEKSVETIKDSTFQEKQYLKKDMLSRFDTNYWSQLLSDYNYIFMKEINNTIKNFFMEDSK